MHVLNYFQDQKTKVVFPVWYRTGEEGRKHSGFIPAFFKGPDYWAVPLAMTARWQRANGGSATWVTPLFHVGKDAQGKTTDWHAANVIHHGANTQILPVVFRGPNHLVIAPFYYQFHSKSGTNRGVLPVYVAGPNWWSVPLAMTGAWKGATGSATTLVTPLYHRTTNNHALRHMHVLNYIATPRWSTAFPVWWDWRTATGDRRQLALPLWYRRVRADGDRTVTVFPGLFSYHRGPRLDTSFARQLIPFQVQKADNGREVNLFWWIFHLREHKHRREGLIGPVWFEHRDGAPVEWQFLGGVCGRQNNYRTNTSQNYLLWLIPLGKRQKFSSPTPVL